MSSILQKELWQIYRHPTTYQWLSHGTTEGVVNTVANTRWQQPHASIAAAIGVVAVGLVSFKLWCYDLPYDLPLISYGIAALDGVAIDVMFGICFWIWIMTCYGHILPQAEHITAGGRRLLYVLLRFGPGHIRETATNYAIGWMVYTVLMQTPNMRLMYIPVGIIIRVAVFLLRGQLRRRVSGLPDWESCT